MGEPQQEWHVAKAVVSLPSPIKLRTDRQIKKVMGTGTLLSPATPTPSTPLCQLPVEDKPTGGRPSRPATYRGPWMPTEITRIREIVEKSYQKVEGMSMVNWNLVAESFGPTRSKHQILCKAVDLGLKGKCTAGPTC